MKIKKKESKIEILPWKNFCLSPLIFDKDNVKSNCSRIIKNATSCNLNLFLRLFQSWFLRKSHRLLLNLIIKGLSSKEWRTKRVEKSEKKSAKVETFRIYQEDLSPKKNVDGVVILDWWGKKEAPPYLKRLTEDCGGCYLTNDQKRGIFWSNFHFENANAKFNL